MLPRTCYRGKKTTPVATLSYIQHSGDTAAKTDAGDKYTGLDRFGRVIDQVWRSVAGSVTIMDRYQYGYDRAGNRLFKNNLLDTALSELYGYDNLNQTTSFSRGVLSDANSDGLFDTVASPSRTQAWNLDALGNWSTFTTNNTSQSRSHNAQNQLTAVGSTTLSYDANGSMTADEAGRTFIYDAWNRLAAVRNSSNSPIVTYSIDALGRRITEDRPNANTVDHLYYSTGWQVLQERRGGIADSNIRRQYFWSIDYVDALSGRVDYASGAVSATYHTQYDANWNITAIADATSGVLERYIYDPYGTATVLYANWTVRGDSSYGWDYLHQGGQFDVDSNLYHFRYRDYLPTLGRWTQTDSLGFDAGDVKLYRYIHNDPENKIDPLGHSDSLTLSFWQLMAQGKINEAIALLSLAQQTGFDIGKSRAGISAVEGVISAIIKKLPAESGKCADAAEKISGLFKAIGEKHVTYKIIEIAGARYFGLPDGRIFAERGWHMVVRCQGKMYDALTGPRGMSWEEYKEFLAKLKIIAIPIRMPD